VGSDDKVEDAAGVESGDTARQLRVHHDQPLGGAQVHEPLPLGICRRPTRAPITMNAVEVAHEQQRESSGSSGGGNATDGSGNGVKRFRVARPAIADAKKTAARKWKGDVGGEQT